MMLGAKTFGVCATGMFSLIKNKPIKKVIDNNCLKFNLFIIGLIVILKAVS